VAAQRDTRALSTNPVHSEQLLVVGRDPASVLFVDVAADGEGHLPATNVPARRIVPVVLAHRASPSAKSASITSSP